jgi:plastocyanin
MRRLLATVFALPLVLVAAGCGGSSSSAKLEVARDGALVVHMQNLQFVPEDITVRVGQKVRWINDDTVDHNVVADSGARFHSSIFGQGRSYEFTPRKPGTVKYECTLHPGMVGTLTVK